MFESRLAVIASKFARLRELDPNGSVLFGGPTHIYKLNPPATPELVEKYEAEFNVTLPLEYREFVLQVGNGGGGPYYGLWPIYVPAPEEYEKATYSEYDGVGGWEYNENYPMFEKASICPFSADEKYRTGVPVDYDNLEAQDSDFRTLPWKSECRAVICRYCWYVPARRLDRCGGILARTSSTIIRFTAAIRIWTLTVEVGPLNTRP
jgi:hypothetical protein